jgi:hypothetical protein
MHRGCEGIVHHQTINNRGQGGHHQVTTQTLEEKKDLPIEKPQARGKHITPLSSNMHKESENI